MAKAPKPSSPNPPVAKPQEVAAKPKKPKETPQPQPLPARSYQKMEGPPAPVSAEKHQRLDELLRKYRADEITPDQYHQERAKILAAP
jgi:hypothetical protein